MNDDKQKSLSLKRGKAKMILVIRVAFIEL